MKRLFLALIIVLLHSVVLSQNKYLSFGANYSWMNKIESSVNSKQVFSPGAFIQFGREFTITEKVGWYLSSDISWLSGGVQWREVNLDLRVKANYNNLRLGIEGGLFFFPHKKTSFVLGLNNSFGSKLSGQFSFVEQQTFRNWAPMIITKLRYQKTKDTRWSLGVNVATGLRQIRTIRAVNTETILFYESSNNFVAIEFRRYLR